MNWQRSPNNCRSFNFSLKMKKKEKIQTWTPALRCFAHWQSGRPPRGLKCQASCHSHIPAHLCLPVISAIGNRLRHPQRPSASLAPADTAGCQAFVCYIGDVTFDNSSSNGETSGAINWAWKATRDVWAGLSVCSQRPAVGKSFTRDGGDTMSSVRKHSAEWSTNQLVDWVFFFLCLCCSLSGVESSLIWLITASPIRR